MTDYDGIVEANELVENNKYPKRICGKANVMVNLRVFSTRYRAAEEHCDGSDNEEDWRRFGHRH